MTESPNPHDISDEHASSPARRTVIRGAAAVAGLAAVAPLGAGTARAAEQPNPTGKSDLYKREDGDVAAAYPVSTEGGLKPLGPVSDVPVGQGKIYDAQKIVVTQPKKGQWHAFSAVCTHQQCVVADCDGGKINCGCHNSSFDFTTGAPEGGPATVPLPKKKVKIVKGKITAG
jgi:nitrite reductase/ring-hydroxylating ferredoxin subunit